MRIVFNRVKYFVKSATVYVFTDSFDQKRMVSSFRTISPLWKKAFVASEYSD